MGLTSALSWPSPRAEVALCLALLLLGCAVLVVAAAAAQRRPARTAAVADRWGDEPALALRRDPRATQVSSWGLLGVGVVTLLGAGFAVASTGWVLAALLTLAGGVLLVTAAPHRDLAGGLWLTPSRLVHAYRGRRWTVAWADVRATGAGPPPVVIVSADRLPTEERYGPRGRVWRRSRSRGDLGLLGIEVEGLPLTPDQVEALVRRSVEDVGFRQALGRD